ncbi:MAG TPA: T9SS type A sorting domain-containing protein [Bacteroidia bacterium]|jgi:hypothetical protein
MKTLKINLGIVMLCGVMGFAGGAKATEYDVIANPANGVVPKFTKLEYSIKVSSAIQTYIDNFINNVSHPRLNPFYPDDINVEAHFVSPSGVNHTVYGFYYRNFQYAHYDPQTRLWGSVESPPISTTDVRWQPLDDDYEFKVRFSPDEVGDWRCTIAMTYSGMSSENFTFEPLLFTCTDSDEKGYITTGNNGYLKFSETGESFFPIGAYLGCVNDRGDGYDPSIDESVNYVRASRPVEYSDYMGALEDTWNNGDHGANYVRVIMFSHSWCFEWEELGNYYNRMPHAWELDRLVEWAEQHNVYVNLDVLPVDGYNDRDGTDNTIDPIFGSWNDNPYRTCLPNNGEDPTGIITDLTARKKLKNYLRYLVARWGYSTHIEKFELNSECNQTGRYYVKTTNPNDPNCLEYDPYTHILFRKHDLSNCQNNYDFTNFQYQPMYNWQSLGWDPSWDFCDIGTSSITHHYFSEDLYLWFKDLSSFMKNDLGVKQMINTSYALADGLPNGINDNTFADPLVSVTTSHHYSIDANENLLRANLTTLYKNTYRKPFAFEEEASSDVSIFTGSTPSGPNCHKLTPNHFPPAGTDPFYGGGDIEMHNMVWATAFMGVYGVFPAVVPGPSATSQWYTTEWREKGHTREFFQYNVPALQSFFNGLDFENFSYRPYHEPQVNNANEQWQYVDVNRNNIVDEPDDIENPLEKFILEGGTQSMGWIHMRRANWSTVDNNPGNFNYYGYCHCYVGDCNISVSSGYSHYLLQDPLAGTTPFMITGQTMQLPVDASYAKYHVDWYDTRNPNDLVQQDVELVSNSEITLHIPPLGMNVSDAPNGCASCRPDIAFKVYPDNGHGFQRNGSPQQVAHIQVMPNPSKGVFMVQSNLELPSLTIEVKDMLGNTIFKKKLTNFLNEQVDLSAFSNGIYAVHVYDDVKINETYKVIKE